MASMDTVVNGTALELDWMQCELIERIPGKVSGQPLVRGTRILPDAIVNSYDLGDTVEDIHEGFPTLSITQIKRLIDFANAQRGLPEHRVGKNIRRDSEVQSANIVFRGV